MGKRLSVYLVLALLATARLEALTDFITDNPRLIITINPRAMEQLDDEGRQKTADAEELIKTYFADWQSKFGKLHRHIKINIIPVERQISVGGSRAEGIWSWNSFKNEEGSVVLGIVGDLYVNINSTYVSQEALVAHEASHAFLLTYYPKILDNFSQYTMYNEGLAEIFSINYEPKPWKQWDKLLLAKRFNERFAANQLSGYGYRVLMVLSGRARLPHDFGFFYLHVVKNGKIDLDRDLRECTNEVILEEIAEWMKKNGKDWDLPMIRD